MKDARRISRRGVYYDLDLSPYEYQSPYGDLFKFSSEKKLTIYTRDVEKEIQRLEALFDRYDLTERIPEEIATLIRREVYRAFYTKVER